MQVIVALLVWLIGLGLLLALAFWAMANIWLLLGILAAILVVLIIYGIATSDNEWVSGITNLILAAIVLYIVYLVFN
mgnify:CR=1 FL=1